MDEDNIERILRIVPPSSRRWIMCGALGAMLAGVGALHDADRTVARKKGKGSKGKKKRKRCRGGCQQEGATCQNGQCRCPANTRDVAECLPGEDRQWCIPAPGNPKICCPEQRIYAVCPIGSITPTGCTAPEAQAPDVCCPEAKLCGSRCCEAPFQCIDASTSTCTGAPPIYARIRRLR